MLWFECAGFATGGQDYTQWNLPDGAIARLGKGRVSEVAFSPDGKFLAVATSIGIWLYDTRTLEELALLTGHTSGVNSVSFSPDGRTLASGSGDDTVKLWSVSERKEIATLKGHSWDVLSVSFSPDGSVLASGSEDGTVKLWSVSERKEIATFKGKGRPEKPEERVASIPDMEAALRALLSGHSEHTGRVCLVSFSPYGSMLASGSWDGTVKLWSVSERKEIATFNTGIVLSVSFSPDGRVFASGRSYGGIVKLWSVSERKEIATFKGHTSEVTSVSLSPDGSVLASGSMDGTVKLWSVSERKEIATLKGHSWDVLSVSFSPDGSVLASGSWDGTVKLWSVSERKEIATLKGHISDVTSISFSSDGRTLAGGTLDGTVKLWSVLERKEIATFEGHTSEVTSVSFSPDGKMLASGSLSSDATVKLWSVSERKEIATLKGHSWDVLSVSFSPDGSVLASGSGDGTVKLWSVSERKEVATLKGHTSAVTSVSFSPGGKVLASGSEDGTILLWDLKRFGNRPPVATTPSTMTTPSGNRIRSFLRLMTNIKNTKAACLLVAKSLGTSDSEAGKGKLKVQPSGTHPRFFADLEVLNPRFLELSLNRALDAEERGRISFTLENRGRGTAEEVEVSLVLLTDTIHLTYPKTTQIGSLASEEKKEVEIPVTAGFNVADGTATFRITVSEKWGFEPDPFTVTFDTKAFVPPNLVIDDANIGIDDDKQGDSYGDNDSKIELKETIEVTVAVQNTGAGDAEGVKAEVTIEGEGQDIYYNSPSAIFELGNIPAGDYKQFTFAFSTNNRYKRRDLPITVNITESKGKYGLTKLLGLTVDTPIKSSRDVVVTKIEQPQRTVTLTAPILTSLADKAPTNAIPQFSDAVAVIFGIEEYRSAPPATFANRDATIFYDYAKSVFGIPERNIHLATNELATKGTFDKVFGEDGWISRRVTPNETEVFLFYSGHGAPATDKSQYLIPQDADPNYAKTTGVALNQLYESLNKLKAKHVMIFIDACFSGAGRPIEKEQKPMLLADARPIFVTVEGPLAYGNMTVMTASTGAQISSGYPDQKHGLFTFYLLMGLHGEADLNSDKAVTVGELKNYLEKNIPDKALELYDREQTPVVQTNEVGRVIVQFK
jgi:WD40 repeat protein